MTLPHEPEQHGEPAEHGEDDAEDSHGSAPQLAPSVTPFVSARRAAPRHPTGLETVVRTTTYGASRIRSVPHEGQVRRLA